MNVEAEMSLAGAINEVQINPIIFVLCIRFNHDPSSQTRSVLKQKKAAY